MRAAARTERVSDIAALAGCSETTVRYWMADSAFAARVHEARRRYLQIECGSLGLRIVRELVESAETPAAVRLQGALRLIGLAGHHDANGAPAPTDAAALADLTEDQLRQHIAAAEAALAALRRPVLDGEAEDVPTEDAPDVAPDSPDPASLL